MNGTGRRKGRPGFYAEFRDRFNGQVIHRTRHFMSQAAAREFVKRHNAKLDLRLLDEIPAEPLVDAVAEFREGRQHLSQATRNDDRLFLTLLVAKSKREAVCDVTAADVDLVLQNKARKTSAVTAAKARSTIRTFFNWAITRGYADANPVKGTRTKVNAKARRERPFISDAELSRLIDAIPDEDCRIAVWLTLTTGMDRQVIAGLHAGNFELTECVVRFRRRKTGQIIQVPLHPSLVPLIQPRVAACPRGAPILKVPRQQDRDSDWWRSATKVAGLEGILFRDLRAHAVSRLHRAGVSLSDASKLLGHASIETTHAHYMTPPPGLATSIAELPLPGIPASSKSTAG